MDTDVAMQRGNEDVVELVATIAGQKYGVNCHAATSNRAFTEGHSAFLVFLRLRRNPNLPSVIGDWEMERQAAFDEAAKKQKQIDDALQAARAAAVGAASGSSGVPGSSAASGGSGVAPVANPMEQMYEDMSNFVPGPTPTVKELFGDDFKKRCGTDDPNRLYWHLWLPYHSPDGTPPDMSLWGEGEVQYIGTFQHAMRGDNAPTLSQVKAARQFVFGNCTVEQREKAKGELDRAEWMLRNRQPF
jgi:hypothetical protein